jgi:hypothetical protein
MKYHNAKENIAGLKVLLKLSIFYYAGNPACPRNPVCLGNPVYEGNPVCEGNPVWMRNSVFTRNRLSSFILKTWIN